MSYRKKHPLHFQLVIIFVGGGMILGPLVGYLTFYNPLPSIFPTPLANVTQTGQPSNKLYDQRVVPQYPLIIISGIPAGGLIGGLLMYIYLYGPFPFGGASPEERAEWKREIEDLKREREEEKVIRR